MSKKNIIFFVRHFLERGSEVAIYQYAHYNETILGNKSYIACFTKGNPIRTCEMGICESTYDKFKNRFTIFELNMIEDIRNYIDTYNISVFYTLAAGGEDVYKFHDKTIWGECKTIKHCVFQTNAPESDYYCCISDYLSKKDKNNIPVFPHMIDLPETQDNMRALLHIPEEAIVFGGYGGKDSFSIGYVHGVVEYVANLSLETPIYFLFANFHKFCPDNPRIIHLPMILDSIEKVKFINTCDAMLWARSDGETFGIAIGEFSSKNKPIICSAVGDLAHVDFLGKKAFLYKSLGHLTNILLKFSKESVKDKDWNCFREYTPEKVMTEFNNILEKLLRNKV